MVGTNFEYDRPTSALNAETNSCSSNLSCRHVRHTCNYKSFTPILPSLEGQKDLCRQSVLSARGLGRSKLPTCSASGTAGTGRCGKKVVDAQGEGAEAGLGPTGGWAGRPRWAGERGADLWAPGHHSE
jgi:hypothetical protein